MSELSLSTLSFIKSCKLDSEKINFEEETGRDSHQIALEFLLIGIKQGAHDEAAFFGDSRINMSLRSRSSFESHHGSAAAGAAALQGDGCSWAEVAQQQSAACKGRHHFYRISLVTHQCYSSKGK